MSIDDLIPQNGSQRTEKIMRGASYVIASAALLSLLYVSYDLHKNKKELTLHDATLITCFTSSVIAAGYSAIGLRK